MHGEFGRFALPVWVNGMRAMALRDSGCALEAIVHPKWVQEQDYTGDFVFCRGAFDNGTVTHKVPIANIEIVAPQLGCFRPITLQAGVWELTGVDCLLGNKLFEHYSDLQDIVGNSSKASQPIIKMSQIRNNDQNSNTPCHSIGPDLAVGHETDPGVSDTLTARDFDTADRQKLNLGVDTPRNGDSVADHVAGDSISTQVQDEIETAHDDCDVNNLTHDALGETQTVANEINVTGVVGSELIDDNVPSPTDEVGRTQTGVNGSYRPTNGVTNGSGNQPTYDVVVDSSATLDQAEINDLPDTDLTVVKAVVELTDNLDRHPASDVQNRSVQVGVSAEAGSR